MTPAAHLTRLRCRIALWLAVLMAVSGGMASGPSYGALGANPAAPWLAEICTAPQATAAADGTRTRPVEQRGQNNGAHFLQHCSLCVLGGHAFGPPPTAAVWWSPSQAVVAHASWRNTARHDAAPVWRALPRGPPALL